MFLKNFIFSLLITGSLFTSVLAQNTTVDTLAVIKEKKATSWIVLPVVYYAPETRFGFGALGMHLFKFNMADTTTRTSNIQAYVLYTLNNQLLISPRYVLFFDQEKYVLSGNIAYFKFPRFYYGIGNDLPEENKELVDYTLVRAENRVLRKLRPNLFGGIQWNYYQVYDVEQKENGLLANTKPAGWNGYISSGAGLALTYDTRDIVVNASKGIFIELSSIFYRKSIGSEYNYNQHRYDLRRYFKLNKQGHILTFQSVGQFNSGQVPFLQLSQLGNDKIMRGYYEGRYRDKQLIAFQAEYRLPIVWRFGAVAFVGVGDVADKVSKFAFQNMKPNYGAGLRFMINEEEKVNIRLDYGWGKETSGFYLEITEAF